MNKKIIILNGSPRKTGNTAALSAQFKRGAEGNGFEETLYWYDNLEKHIGFKSIGKVLCSDVMAVGDIKDIIIDDYSTDYVLFSIFFSTCFTTICCSHFKFTS